MKCQKCKKEIETPFQKIMEKDIGWFIFVLLGAIWNELFSLLSFSWALQLIESLIIGLLASFLWGLFNHNK